MTVEPSPHRKGLVLAGCDVGGVLRSEDYGHHWRLSNRGLISDGDRAVAAFAWDPRHPRVVYMASGVCFGKPSGPYGGLWRSEDEGKSWHLLSRQVRFSGFGSQRQWGKVLVVDQRDGAIWAGTAWDGLRQSSDGGKTWTSLGLGGRFIVGLAVNPAGTGALYVAAAPTKYSQGGVFVSRDGGKTWTETLAGQAVRSLAAVPRQPGRVYVAVRDRGLLVSEDFGKTWQPCVAGIESYLEKLWANAVAINSALPQTVYLAAAERVGQVPHWWQWRHPDLFVSRDAGRLWAPIISASVKTGRFDREEYLANVDASPWWRPKGWFAFNPMGWGLDPREPEHLYIHDWYGVWASDDGGEHWRSAMDGLASTCVRTIVLDPTRRGMAFFGLADVGFFRTRDAGCSVEHFESRYPASNCTNLAAEGQEGGETLLYSVAGGRLWMSRDGGKTWTPRPAPPGGAKLGPVALDRFKRGLLYCGRWFSPDGGQRWKELAGLPEGWSGHVVSDPTKKGRLYAWNSLGVCLSTDGGRTWSDIAQGIPAVYQGKRRICGLDVLPGDGGGRVFVASAVHGLLASDDRGKTWRTVLPHRYVSALDCCADGRTVAAAAWTPWYAQRYEPGVFLSRDGGRSWARIDGGGLGVPARPSAIVLDDLVPGRVWLGTGGNGVFVGEFAE